MTTKQRRTSAEISDELIAANSRLQVVAEEIKQIEDRLKALKSEKRELDGGEFAYRGAGRVSQLSGELADAKRYEADLIAMRAIFAKGFYTPSDAYVVTRVTAKRIFARQIGWGFEYQFYLDGKGISGNFDIDIKATFGVDEINPGVWKQIQASRKQA